MLKRILIPCVLALSLFAPARALSEADISPLVAPYALYPDTLLAQVLAASTYPDQVQAAAAWDKSNPGLSGSSLDNALASQSWDNSVKSLCAFPDVLDKMNGNLDNTRQLGVDFLNDQQAVMECVQDLRAKAQSMGALNTTPQQTVSTQGSNIIIQPAQPDNIYVPAYDPDWLYGAAYPAYAPGAGLVTFGTGVAVGAAFNNNWGAFDWNNHYLYTGAGVRGVGNTYNYNNVNVNRWQHNSYNSANINNVNRNVNNNFNNTSYRNYTGSNYRGYNTTNANFNSNTNLNSNRANSAYQSLQRNDGGQFQGNYNRDAFSGGDRGFSNSGFENRSANRGWSSMGGSAGHFGGGGFRGGRR